VQRSEADVAGLTVPVLACHTLVVGSGAASLGAALSLHAADVQDVLIATEEYTGGTSRNAGSDKQTYYTSAVAGGGPGAVDEMVRDLCDGGSMHGDIALIEAANSARAFHRLVELGLPFPRDTYGLFPGYRTDHDRRGRGTSAGPLTSRWMTEALGGEVERRSIPILDGHRVIALLTDDVDGETAVIGALALDLEALAAGGHGFVLFRALNVILGTGGPGALYADSVYPASQFGSTGLALRAGARAVNLTESQFGIASLDPRWNLSGSYQQVLPRYLSRAPDGSDEREFLTDVFPDRERLLAATFRKGYEWPFDPRRVADYGSSLIDLLVWRERTERGRRVFLDYTVNPAEDMEGGAFGLDRLPAEAAAYLEKSGARGVTPIERLEQMNPAAVAFYTDRGRNLAREALGIAVCAQHCNGGLEGNIWSESNLRHLFCVGELNGSHGVYRPGGAALNAGQVGGLRAAEYIAARCTGEPPEPAGFLNAAAPVVQEHLDLLERALARGEAAALNPASVGRRIAERMSAAAAHVRRPAAVDEALTESRALLDTLDEEIGIASRSAAGDLFRARDLALTERFWLEAIAEYLARGGGSRGSYLVPDPGGEVVNPELGEAGRIRIAAPGDFCTGHMLTLRLDAAGGIVPEWIEPRPIPDSELWFEEVWARYREWRGERG